MKFLYHANCNDGSAAALAAWMVLGDEGNDYIPVQYGQDPPKGLAGQEVVILDFSYPRSVICDVAIIAKTLTIIDHHKTAQADLSEPFPEECDGNMLCPIHCIFDMETSGSILAWDYFQNGEPPDLFRHVEDRDLWRFEMEGTKEVHAALQLYPEWREWMGLSVEKLIMEGSAVTRFLTRKSEQIVSAPTWQEWNAYTYVPVYNIRDFMISDTLHMALEKYPESPFAVAYFDMQEKREYSLRSRQGSDIDVSEVAKTNGGGGHKHAAGFITEIP